LLRCAWQGLLSHPTSPHLPQNARDRVACLGHWQWNFCNGPIGPW
jgi:hypothetical protein